MSSRSIAAKFGLAIAGTVFALALGEIAVRALPLPPLRYPQPRHLENADKSVGLDLYPTPPAGGVVDADLRDANVRSRFEAEGLGIGNAWQHAPYAIVGHYNADRCRDVARTPKREGATRVLVLGDSFTEGQGVRQGATFARVLEQRMRTTGRDVEVINCGRRGRDFPALFEAFELLVPAYEPDVVVYAMVLNDAAQSPAFHAQQRFLDDWIVDRRRTLGDGDDGSLPWWRSRVAALIEDRIEGRRIGEATMNWYREMYRAPNAAGWTETQGYLAQMRDAMRARGGSFVIDLLPLLTDWRNGYPFADTSREIARAVQVLDIPFHDAQPSLASERAERWIVHPVDHHPNEHAHARLAEDLAGFLTSPPSRSLPRAPRRGIPGG